MWEDGLIDMLEVQRGCTVRFLAELKRDPSRSNALVLVRRAQRLLDEIEDMIALATQREPE
jgi:hypothetical protein